MIKRMAVMYICVIKRPETYECFATFCITFVQKIINLARAV